MKYYKIKKFQASEHTLDNFNNDCNKFYKIILRLRIIFVSGCSLFVAIAGDPFDVKISIARRLNNGGTSLTSVMDISPWNPFSRRALGRRSSLRITAFQNNILRIFNIHAETSQWRTPHLPFPYRLILYTYEYIPRRDR